jgi:hypothetical protein
VTIPQVVRLVRKAEKACAPQVLPSLGVSPCCENEFAMHYSMISTPTAHLSPSPTRQEIYQPPSFSFLMQFPSVVLQFSLVEPHLPFLLPRVVGQWYLLRHSEQTFVLREWHYLLKMYNVRHRDFVLLRWDHSGHLELLLVIFEARPLSSRLLISQTLSSSGVNVGI